MQRVANDPWGSYGIDSFRRTMRIALLITSPVYPKAQEGHEGYGGQAACIR